MSKYTGTNITDNIFSPLQIGYITDTIEAIDGRANITQVMKSFKDNPRLEAIPISRDGKILGLMTRQIVKNISDKAWKRLFLDDLDKYIIYSADVVDATTYISSFLEEALKQESYESLWYLVQFRQTYMGFVSLKKILEYNNTLRNTDMRLAGQIQQHLLKKSFVNDKRLDICFFNHMAHEIGGDFYQIYTPTKDHILVACFDVAGKNFSAALTTMTLGTCFTFFDLFQFISSPDKVTSRINTLIRNVNPPGIFVAAILFYIDFTNEQILVHNCGFSPILIFVPQSGNKISYKISNPTFAPLGVEDEYDYSESTIVPITRGLRLCAYSDGLTDIVNIHGERYKEEKAINLLKKLHTVPHSRMNKVLNSEIDNWVGNASLADDVTLVDIRFR